jgi:hypothetical protein
VAVLDDEQTAGGEVEHDHLESRFPARSDPIAVAFGGSLSTSRQTTASALSHA